MRRVIACICSSLVLLAAPSSSAQCGVATSSCRTCHDLQRAAPVQGDGTRWHRDHAFADLCGACHGGDAGSNEKASAHAAMIGPLDGDAPACTSCHGRSAAALVEQYRSARQAAAPAASSVAPALAESGPPPPAGPRWRDAGLTLGVLGVGALGALYVARNERRRREAT